MYWVKFHHYLPHINTNNTIIIIKWQNIWFNFSCFSLQLVLCMGDWSLWGHHEAIMPREPKWLAAALLHRLINITPSNIVSTRIRDSFCEKAIQISKNTLSCNVKQSGWKKILGLPPWSGYTPKPKGFVLGSCSTPPPEFHGNWWVVFCVTLLT